MPAKSFAMSGWVVCAGSGSSDFADKDFDFSDFDFSDFDFSDFDCSSSSTFVAKIFAIAVTEHFGGT